AEIADRVGVMYSGRLVEEAGAGEIFASPKHPYTRGLLAAIPDADRDGGGSRRLRALPGTPPDPTAPPPGCRFHPRCRERFAPCDSVVPELLPLSPSGRAACLLHETLGAGAAAGAAGRRPR